MARRYLLLATLVLGAMAAFWLLETQAQPVPTPVPQPEPKPVKQEPKKPAIKVDEIIQEFPVGGEMQTAWKVKYVSQREGGGFSIAGAWFKRTPNDEWFKVLENVRLSEIFVPYNNGTRIYDIGSPGNYKPLKHTQADAGVHGKLLNDGMVVQELRDTGLLWKMYDKARRGQELVLWSTLGAGNYNYVMEYSFRCDGVINCKLGSTGRNYGNHETTGHMHHGCWRIDMDLGTEPNKNEVFVVRRVENKGDRGAKDEVEPFNNGVEGGIEWKAEEFTRLRVQCSDKNGQNKPICYELYPLRQGTPRHYQAGEEYTHFDFWVTPFQWDEQYYRNLPKWVKQKRPIREENVVLWYMSPGYHLPRDEDGVYMKDGRAQLRGVATVMWCGFELRPRNFFEKTPLYP